MIFCLLLWGANCMEKQRNEKCSIINYKGRLYRYCVTFPLLLSFLYRVILSFVVLSNIFSQLWSMTEQQFS